MGVQGTLTSARIAVRVTDQERRHLDELQPVIMASEDVKGGLMGLVERRAGTFTAH